MWLCVSLGVMYIVLNGGDGAELCTQIWGWERNTLSKEVHLAGAENEESC